MELFAQINPQMTVVTPNRRLSATLQKKYNEFQLNQQHACWLTVDTLPFTNWIERLWQESNLKNFEGKDRILTSQQEQIVWEEILTNSSASQSLLQLSAAAETAKSAWNILKQWQVDLNHHEVGLMEDSRIFLEWINNFTQICQKNNWLDTASLIEEVHLKIKHKKTILPNQLAVVGFTELTPLQKEIFFSCEQAGTKVFYFDKIYSNATDMQKISRVSLPDSVTEIETMARWAKAIKDSSEAKNSLSIGCIVPNLEKIRDRVEEVFLQVFIEPGNYTLNYTTSAFNISAGKNLASYPIIHAAIHLLKLPLQLISATELSNLLRSPFFGEAELERFKRAEYDTRSRNANILETSIERLLDRSTKLTLYHYCPCLAKRLADFLAYFRALPPLLNTKEWVAHFHELLLIMAWPGERSLNSHEFQIVQRWLELLNEYQKFNSILSSLTYRQALYYLIYLAKTAIYQPQSPEAPVQILGMLEAAGLPFDYMWIMGLDDATWPPIARPNPFIPHFLQKKFQMPHSSAEREFTYSVRLTQQLKQSANNIIFSHSQKEASFELRPSPFITSFPEIEDTQISSSNFVRPALIIFTSQKIEKFLDEQAPPVAPNERILGGASLLKQQAACPFKAFATIRLQARPLEAPTIGLRHHERGIIIHKTLEKIWHKITYSTDLLHHEENVLKEFLLACIIETIEKLMGKNIAQSRYLALEAQRLHILLWDWLEVEKKRPHFKVIAHEYEYKTNVGSLPLTLRIDRIDELANGTHLLIDYKTGKNNFIKYWFGDLPEEPQLPLYCISNNNIAGIAFAEINAENITYKGTSQHELDITGIRPINEISHSENRSWSAQLQHWQKILEKLSNAFIDGDAKVKPKDIHLTCRYCDLQSFCRVQNHAE